MADRDERDYSPGWRRFTEIVLPTPIRGLMKLEAAGQSYFPPGGMIVAANHLSYADWPAMALFCYVAGHYPVFTIKSPVFDVKIIGPLMRKLGQLPVYRGRADAALVLKEAEQRIGRGACVIFYPEGTASRDPDQWPMVAKTGVARLALSTGAPVVPVACWGAQVILPYGDKRPKLFPRQTVKIAAGPPGGPIGFRRPAAHRRHPAACDRRHHGRRHQAAGRAARRAAACRPLRPAGRAGEGGRGPGRDGHRPDRDDADRRDDTDRAETDTDRTETDTDRTETDADRTETIAGPAGDRAGAEPATGDRTVRGQAEDGRAGTEPAAGEPRDTEGGSDPQDTRKAQQG